MSKTKDWINDAHPFTTFISVVIAAFLTLMSLLTYGELHSRADVLFTIGGQLVAVYVVSRAIYEFMMNIDATVTKFGKRLDKFHDRNNWLMWHLEVFRVLTAPALAAVASMTAGITLL